MWLDIFAIEYLIEEGYFEYGNFEACYFEFEIKLFQKKKLKRGKTGS